MKGKMKKALCAVLASAALLGAGAAGGMAISQAQADESIPFSVQAVSTPSGETIYTATYPNGNSYALYVASGDGYIILTADTPAP